MADYDETTDPFADLRGLSVDELQAEDAKLRAQITGWDETRDGDVRKYNATVARAGEVVRAIEAHNNIRRTFERGAGGSVERAFGSPQYMQRTGVFADEARAVLEMGDQQVRSRALKALEQRGRDLPADQGDQLDGFLRSTISVENPHMDGAALARRLLISESDAYRSAFAQIMQNPHPILTAEEAEAVRAMQRLESVESRGMSEGSGPVGSYGIPVLIDPSIMLSSGAGAAPILDIARVVPSNTNSWKGVSSAPPTFSWDAEGTAVSDDSPTLAQPSISVYTTRGFIPYTLELGMDYPNFAQEMMDLLSQGYLDIMASTTATGTGSSQPFGVFTKLDATTTSEVRVTTVGSLGAVDVFKAWNALPERFRSRASWVMSVSTESQIRSLATTSAGQATSYFTVDMNAEGLSRLNGRPVVVTDYAPTFVSAATTSANIAVVGDFKNYTVVRRSGLAVEPIANLLDTATGRPNGTRGFFAYARAGADVTVTNGLRLINQT